MYLKTRGIDPATHPVTDELERVKSYYAKIRAIEFPEKEKRMSLPARCRKRLESTTEATRSVPCPKVSAAFEACTVIMILD